MKNGNGKEAIEKLIKGNRLKRADVVLTRGKKSLLSKLIMFGTKSNWSHAALVFVIRNEKEGFENTFVLESVGDGVDVTDLSYYLERPAKYDVGIKRLETDWFQGEKEVKIRKTVRGHMLNFIKAEYDMGTIFQVARMILRKIIFGTRIAFRDFEKEVKRYHRKNRLVPSQFICSGFVQYAFYETVRNLIGKGDLFDDAQRDVIFNPQLKNRTENVTDRLSILLATTPENLAKTDKLTWKFVVKDGQVHEVHSTEEVDAIFKGKTH